MADKYIFQLRRGWKDDASGRDDWAKYEATEGHVMPQAGELVVEYDNGIPRLKIGDGINEFNALPYMSVDSFILPKPTTITLRGGDGWVAEPDGRYVQDITNQLAGKTTIYSKVDLQPTPEQLCFFSDNDVSFTTVNKEGVVSVYAIGVKPENDYENIQVTITEVVPTPEIIGNTTTISNSDGKIDVVLDAQENNVAIFSADGGIKDSGQNITDLLSIVDENTSGVNVAMARLDALESALNDLRDYVDSVIRDGGIRWGQYR